MVMKGDLMKKRRKSLAKKRIQKQKQNKEKKWEEQDKNGKQVNQRRACNSIAEIRNDISGRDNEAKHKKKTKNKNIRSK